MARRPRRRPAQPRRGVREPRAVERRYISALQDIYAACSADVAAALAPILARWEDGQTDRADAVQGEEIARVFSGLRLILGRRLRSKATNRILYRVAEEGDEHVRRELGTLLRIDLRREVPGLAKRLAAWRRANIELIESGILAESASPRLRGLLPQVERVVREAYQRGARVEVLRGELQERFDVSRSRAALIARDQTLKLNSQVNAFRQQKAGITSYRWVTSRDERVRDAHAALDGDVYRWDDPPVMSESGERGNPGDDYQCRCIAVPVLPDTYGLDE